MQENLQKAMTPVLKRPEVKAVTGKKKNHLKKVRKTGSLRQKLPKALKNQGIRNPAM